MNGLDENVILIDFDADNPIYSFARLKKLSTEQGYITYDDVLRLFPEAEQNIDYLDQIYVSIHNAGILFIEKNILKDDALMAEAIGMEKSVYLIIELVLLYGVLLLAIACSYWFAT